MEAAEAQTVTSPEGEAVMLTVVTFQSQAVNRSASWSAQVGQALCIPPPHSTFLTTHPVMRALSARTSSLLAAAPVEYLLPVSTDVLVEPVRAPIAGECARRALWEGMEAQVEATVRVLLLIHLMAAAEWAPSLTTRA